MELQKPSFNKCQFEYPLGDPSLKGVSRYSWVTAHGAVPSAWFRHLLYDPPITGNCAICFHSRLGSSAEDELYRAHGGRRGLPARLPRGELGFVVNRRACPQGNCAPSLGQFEGGLPIPSNGWRARPHVGMELAGMDSISSYVILEHKKSLFRNRLWGTLFFGFPCESAGSYFFWGLHTSGSPGSITLPPTDLDLGGIAIGKGKSQLVNPASVAARDEAGSLFGTFSKRRILCLFWGCLYISMTVV